MENSVISFPCPVCAIKLTVPARLAGVVGPCPSCRNEIQAPQAVLTPPPAQTAQFPQTLQPIPPPTPVATAPEVEKPTGDHSDSHATPAPQAPLPVTPPARILAADLAATSPMRNPQPKQIPAATSHGKRAANSTAEAPPMSTNETGDVPAVPKRAPRKNGLARWLFVLLYIAAIATIGSGVVSFLKDRSEKTRFKQSMPKTPAKTTPPKSVTPPEPADSPEPPNPPEPSIPALPVPSPEPPKTAEQSPSVPDKVEPPTPSQAATEVLKKFLAAETLTERLSLVATQTPEPALAKSCLAGPLPRAKEVFIEAIQNDAGKQTVDFYHHVTFETDAPNKKAQTILVQKRGDADPKVMVDPFLDSYGGRLAAYAETASDLSGTFQVTILPLASCSDEKVPNRQKKLTLKLLPQDDAKEIALAFFDKDSKIARMLEDGTYSLSYGKAKACTVVLRWNTEERRATPFLEVVDLKTLDWNP